MSRPEMLDLCCCQGGATAGYVAAGWTVTGIDNTPQPRYPAGTHATFVLADAVTYLRRLITTREIRRYRAVHASPPCQAHTNAQKIQGNTHPDLIMPLRQLLRASGLPYIIENVPGAPLLNPITLCGASFGLHTYRHRLFESSVPLTAPEHRRHIAATTKMGRPVRDGDWYHAVGNFSGVAYVRRDLGAPWMNRDGLRECIPPAYSRYLGAQMLGYAGMSVAA